MVEEPDAGAEGNPRATRQQHQSGQPLDGAEGKRHEQEQEEEEPQQVVHLRQKGRQQEWPTPYDASEWQELRQVKQLPVCVWPC